MKWIALLWGLTVAAIVLAANLGWAQPMFATVRQVPCGDKLCHFGLVGGLCFLICLSLCFSRPARQRSAVVLWTIAAFLTLATVEETSQIWLVNRTFSWADLASNTAGILFFGGLAMLWPPLPQTKPLPVDHGHAP